MSHFPAVLVVASLAVCFAAAAGGDDTAAQQQKLAQLRSRIAAVQSRMDQDVGRRSTVQSELRQSERDIARAATNLHELEGKVATAQRRLDELQHQQALKQAALDQQKSALAAQIRAAYAEGRDSELQLLLNAEDPATVERLLTYYDYLNQARAARIQAVRSELQALASLNAQVKTQLADVSSLRDQRAAALARMQAGRDARKQLLVRINSDIHDRNAELTHLRYDEQSIQDLLTNLRQALSDIPPDLEQTREFAKLRGHLQWPVAGRLTHRFGEPLVGKRLPAQGDLIAAPMGTPVRAIAWGRVVYADWLPRFGLLVIVDHGDGYMSIYAHNQSLYAQVGDWLHPGQIIATLGDSGGQEQPALYFEIRHKNTSLDPRKWCRGRLPSA
ncbi:MAG TPA: peptidoglycan DD-metalloendopeptidase family protein [Gammaproteobacteria bacterium]|nr:peptidoglycan DD-metalloendopeptidase family protein [Gammaproteobacteria bacterium]